MSAAFAFLKFLGIVVALMAGACFVVLFAGLWVREWRLERRLPPVAPRPQLPPMDP